MSCAAAVSQRPEEPSPVKRARRSLRGLSAPLMTGFLGLTLFAGCGKPPTFNELIGKKEEQPAATPAPDVVQPSAATPQPAVPFSPDPTQLIESFRQKQSFDILDSDLTQLAGLEFGLDQLAKLNLSHSKVTGEGLKLLPKFTGVTNLNVGGLALSEESLRQIGAMTQLETLGLAQTKLSESDLAQLTGLTNLKELDISSCGISDNAFLALVKLESLEVLKIGSNPISGAGFQLFDKLGARNKLRVIEANSTNFGAQGFPHIRGWKNLEELTVGQSGVTDQGLVLGIKDTTNLRKLDLAYNGLTDFGVRQIVPLKKLEWLSLRNTTGPSDQGVSLLKSNKKLTYLDLEGTACSANVAAFLKKSIPDVKIAVQGQTY